MIKEGIEIIKHSITLYKGTGMYVALFVVALVYIAFNEKNKNIKSFIVYFSLGILLIILNPIYEKLVSKFFSVNTYWRMFWMLPIGLVITYSIVKIIIEKNKKVEKIILFFSALIIIAISGKFIYNKDNFTKSENWYKVPSEAYQVTTIISEDTSKDKKVMPPVDLVPYIRQVNANINLMYARNPYGYEKNQLVQEFTKGNVEYVATECKKENCNYIIFNRVTQLNGDLKDYGYELLVQTANYDIYKLVEE